MARKNTCGNCRFWNYTDDAGECRIRAPIHTIGSFHRSTDLETETAMIACWPNTAETEWCGEHEED